MMRRPKRCFSTDNSLCCGFVAAAEGASSFAFYGVSSRMESFENSPILSMGDLCLSLGFVSSEIRSQGDKPRGIASLFLTHSPSVSIS